METNTKIKNEIKELKPSMFNIIFRTSDNTPLIYNTLNQNFAVINSEEEFRVVKEILSNPNNKWFDKLHKNFYEKLKKGKYLIEKDFEEIDYLNLLHKSACYNMSGLKLCICPTNDCNFKCPYCFEQNIKKRALMNEEIENKIIEFLKQYIQENNPKFLNINWFGGEPLLNINTIKRLSENFIEICKTNNIRYSASMTTNGYLFNQTNINLIKKLKVNSLQITIDGTKDIHNVKRPLKNGGGTYNKIIKNLQLLVKIYKNRQVAVRVNVDKENINSLIPLLNDLTKFQLKNKVYIGIRKVSSCGVIDDIGLFTAEDIADREIDFISEAKRLGWDLNFHYPNPIFGSYCIADNISTLGIDADGCIYKCLTDIGNKELSIGNILDKLSKDVLFINTKSEYLKFDPFLFEECIKCQYFPICKGGCPRESYKNKKKGLCEEIVFSLERKLELMYSEYKESNKSN